MKKLLIRNLLRYSAAMLALVVSVARAEDKPAQATASALQRIYESTKTARGEADYTAIIEQLRAAGTEPLATGDATYARRLQAWALAQRAKARLQPGREKLALADYAEALALEPAQPARLLARSQLYLRLQRWGDGADDLRAALRLAPDDADVLRETAWFLACCPDETFRDADLAVASAERAGKLEATPSFRTLDVLAAALASAGDYSRARTTQQRAITLARQMAAPRVAELQHRLSLYDQSQAYRLPARIR